LFASADVGRILGLSPAAIRAARRLGDLKPAVVSTSGIHLFTREEIDRFAAAREKRRALAKGLAEKRRALAEDLAKERQALAKNYAEGR
jgi:DNA-binding transcriptional MerR regulator